MRKLNPAHLDLTGPEGDDEVGNVDRLGLSGSVRGHDAPVALLSELGGLTDLILPRLSIVRDSSSEGKCSAAGPQKKKGLF